MTKNLTTTDHQKALAQIQKHGVAKYLSTQANRERTESVTKFADYVDGNGKASSNPAMYNAGINRKIKELFGLSKDEITDELMLSVITQLDIDIAMAHQTGINAKLTREQIRKNVHRLCEIAHESYKLKQQVLGGL
ncbi:MAG: hypothetical protein PHD53_00890 [Methylococcales bacterium]|nr:hypothetical protein [Methylococcales bacterium]